MKRLFFCCLLCLSQVYPVQAQNLTLFETVESENLGIQQERQAVSAAPIAPGSPAFTLRSTSRFADSYVGVVQTRDGRSVELNWKAGQNAGVPGFPGYSVLSMSSREITLQHPVGDRCVSSEAAGVSCSGANISVLTLVNLSPLATNGELLPAAGAERSRVANAELIQGALPADGGFVNPFTGEIEAGAQLSEADMALRAERARIRAERLSQFQPERIPDEAVPPGMRVLRTPFGDRLVPE